MPVFTFSIQNEETWVDPGILSFENDFFDSQLSLFFAKEGGWDAMVHFRWWWWLMVILCRQLVIPAYVGDTVLWDFCSSTTLLLIHIFIPFILYYMKLLFEFHNKGLFWVWRLHENFNSVSKSHSPVWYVCFECGSYRKGRQ